MTPLTPRIIEPCRARVVRREEGKLDALGGRERLQPRDDRLWTTAGALSFATAVSCQS